MIKLIFLAMPKNRSYKGVLSGKGNSYLWQIVFHSKCDRDRILLAVSKTALCAKYFLVEKTWISLEMMGRKSKIPCFPQSQKPALHEKSHFIETLPVSPSACYWSKFGVKKSDWIFSCIIIEKEKQTPRGKVCYFKMLTPFEYKIIAWI